MSSFQGIDPVVLAIFLGALSLMPMLLVVCTAFLKIVIVLMITRNAIGVQQVPPGMAINGIALAATLFIMAPVGYEMAEIVKVSPLDLTSVGALQQTGMEAIKPLRTFMLRNSDPDILTHLLENAMRMWPAQMAQEVQREDLILLAPAFVLSQLQAGFEIGFLIYIPFIVIDLIVSNLLLAHGHGQCGTGYRYLPIHLCSDDEPARCQAAGWWSEHGRTRRNRPPAADQCLPVFADPSDERAACGQRPKAPRGWSDPPSNFLVLFSVRGANQREGNRECG